MSERLPQTTPRIYATLTGKAHWTEGEALHSITGACVLALNRRDELVIKPAVDREEGPIDEVAIPLSPATAAELRAAIVRYFQGEDES
jgi:hypothetical protein